jgi:hypothetical protein
MIRGTALSSVQCITARSMWDSLRLSRRRCGSTVALRDQIPEHCNSVTSLWRTCRNNLAHQPSNGTGNDGKHNTRAILTLTSFLLHQKKPAARIRGLDEFN